MIAFSAYFVIGGDTRRFLFREIRTHWKAITLTAALCTISLVLLYGPYATYSRASGTRPLAALELLSPTLGHWFTATEASFLYRGQAFLKPGAIRVESELFGGWIIVLMSLAALLRARRLLRSFHGRAALALVIITGSVMAMITVWPLGGGSWSPYLVIAKVLPPLRAFRAIGRIALLLHLVQAVTALFLLHLVYSKGGRGSRTVAVGLALVMTLEVASLPGRSFSKRTAEARVSRLVSAIDSHDDRHVLAYLPDPTDRPVLIAHIDAWFAAIRMQRVAINGYSGSVPPSHARFLARPDRARLLELLDRTGIPADDVIIVEARGGEIPTVSSRAATAGSPHLQ